MKRLILSSLVLCISVLALSAKREIHPIVGEWEEAGVTIQRYENDKIVEDRDMSFDIYDNYWTFKRLGKFISKDSYGKHKGKWAVSGDLLKIEEKSLPSKYFTIVLVNENTLKISFEEKIFDRKTVTIYRYTRKF